MLQIFCTLLGIAIVLLNTKEKVFVWPLTIIATVLGGSIYYEKGLYAKLLLNVIYLAFCLYGWYQWMHGNRPGQLLQVNKTHPKMFRILLVVGFSLAFILQFILGRLTSADLVYEDSSHTALCLVAQWMTAHKKLESWIVWGIADILFMVICYRKGLYWFGGLHTFYFFLAIHGYYSWKKSYLHGSGHYNY